MAKFGKKATPRPIRGKVNGGGGPVKFRPFTSGQAAAFDLFKRYASTREVDTARNMGLL